MTRAAISVAFFGCVLAAGCTTSETGQIELLGSAAPPAKTPPPKPPMPPACMAGMKCPMPTPYCDTASGTCVECLADAGCTDPMRTVCVVEMGKCVECATDGDCMPGFTCSPDGTCAKPPM